MHRWRAAELLDEWRGAVPDATLEPVEGDTKVTIQCTDVPDGIKPEDRSRGRHGLDTGESDGVCRSLQFKENVEIPAIQGSRVVERVREYAVCKKRYLYLRNKYRAFQSPFLYLERR